MKWLTFRINQEFKCLINIILIFIIASKLFAWERKTQKITLEANRHLFRVIYVMRL